MPEVLPDPDTVRYPLHDASLILSVSEDPISLHTGIKGNVDIYCEKFQLDQSISGTNPSDDSPARLGIFTHTMLGLDSVAGSLAISLPGADGHDSDHPNGRQGGVIDMYVQDLSVTTASKFNIQARGGNGYTPVDKLGDKVGENGGNGGDGGQVSVIIGGKLSNNTLAVDGILDNLADSEKNWPGDFTNDLTEFLRLVEQEDVKAIYQPPNNMKVLEDLQKVKLTSFRHEVRRLRLVLESVFDDLHVALSNAVDAHGGMYGTGSRGSEKTGKSGHQGNDQRPTITFTVKVDDLVRTKVCYVHPVQCRMLLEKAKQLFWSGTSDSKTQSITILERLQERLKPFLTVLGPSSLSVLTQSSLVQAYREAEKRLWIVRGEENDIPVSVKRLMTLASEVEIILKNVTSGMDFYGKRSDEVPRGSFTWYRGIAKDFLDNLKLIEKAYKDWFNNGSDVSAQLNAIRSRGQLCDTTTRQKKTLIEEVIRDLDLNASTIESLTQAFPAARQAVLNEAEKVAHKIKEKFEFPFVELVTALPQLLCVERDPSQVGLKTYDLLGQGLTKIENDEGIQIPKNYLLYKLKRINRSFKGLSEGYKVLDGKVELTDPGAEKLIATEAEWEALLDEFENSLGDNILEGVRKRFQAYIGMVSQRNAAVVKYNLDLVLLVQYHRELESLAVEKEDIVREEYEKLGAEHPSMTAFMKKANQDAVQAAQLWLYKQERAYSFVALSDTHIIGEALRGVSVSQYNLTHLTRAQLALSEHYALYEERKGQPSQKYYGAKFPLAKNDIEDIKEGGRESIMLVVDVPPTADVFNGKANVRLTKVRFFAPGVKTDNHRFEVKLTHSGKEVLVNNHKKQLTFKHDPLKVTFRYNTETNEVKGDDVVDGDIYWPTENDFSLPGPFTRWKIEIRNTVNKNLDLSGVHSAYLEFDFQFETI